MLKLQKTKMCIYYSCPNTTLVNWTVKGMAKMAISEGVRQIFEVLEQDSINDALSPLDVY